MPSTSVVDPVVIVSFARTPLGAFLGTLSSLSATELGAIAIGEAVRRSGIEPTMIEQVVMGCVLPAGLGQAPARQAAISAGLPETTAATTLNKACGSGMQAAIIAHDAIIAGSAKVVVAGGMESMSNAPFLLRRRSGKPVGHDALIDSMMFDGLEDAWRLSTPMGLFAEEYAQANDFHRPEMDAYATQSLARSRRTQELGTFDTEIVPVRMRAQDISISRDEQPDKADPARIPSLSPIFMKDGRITAASSSSISDGAAALVLTRASIARQNGLATAGRIAGHSVFAGPSEKFASAPVSAIRGLLATLDWRISDVDLFEVNEAFAVVPMVTMRELGITPDRMNVHGGACALGHPIGASGARIVVTLLAAMQLRAARRGIASICLAGGEAVAIAIETQL